MKQFFAFLLCLAMLLSMAACGRETENQASIPNYDPGKWNTTPTFPAASNEQSDSTLPKEDDSVNGDLYDALEATVESAVEATLDALTAQWEALSAEVDSFDTYMDHQDQIEAFYQTIGAESEALCVQMYLYGLTYAETVLASGRSTDDMYTDLKGLYDLIYDDMGDEIYDGIYDGILEEMYDAFYSGVLDDRPEGMAYADWYDPRSREYELWSDTRSDTYEQWTDYRSDIYDFWTDLRSELFEDDLEGANEELADFREDVEKLTGKTDSAATEEETTSDTTGGIRDEFKAAMDSYEQFFDEYVAFMKKYMESTDVSGMALAYAEMMQRYLQAMADLEEIGRSDMTQEEALYFAEVMNRINQKLLALA